MKKNIRKSIITQIINNNSEAVLVKNKYKVVCGVIRRIFPKNYAKISPKMWEEIIYQAIGADRDWRLMTEGQDKKNKKRLSDEFIVNNLL